MSIVSHNTIKIPITFTKPAHFFDQSLSKGHHQLSPEKSYLNQGRVTDALLPRTIIKWFPLETI